MENIKVAFASGSDDLNEHLVVEMQALYPELPLYVVSEFPPKAGRWVPYHVSRGFFENLARCREAWKGKNVRLAGVLLMPRMPFWRMRLIALVISPRGFLAFNEHFGSFMLRPRSLGVIVRHGCWRLGNLVRWQLQPGGEVYTFLWRLPRPLEWRLPWLRLFAGLAGVAARVVKAMRPARAVTVSAATLPPGISVVIPSRNGRELLERFLAGVTRDLAGITSEVIVVDNGSDDGTALLLRQRFPQVVIEESAAPLSFARAVNRGIRAARYSHVCLLNNDMAVEPGFFDALRAAFHAVPDLFSATAQIFFPPGVRRQETGKAVMARQTPTGFPVRCDLPIEGENLSYVLYGSGGCSLYDTAKLRALGGIDEVYEPAYVEDLDAGYRAWSQGWPTVFVAGAKVTHCHRATTSRYYSEAQLAAILEVNYLRFLAGAVSSPALFHKLWKQAIERLHLLAIEGKPEAWSGLRFACRVPFLVRRPAAAPHVEESVLALAAGNVAVFPGHARRGKPVVLIASPYLPFPLSHGGAVRMFNLMRRAARDFDQVLVSFSSQLDPPPPELLDICAEIVVVRLAGSHSRPSTPRPDVVEEFDSPAFHAVLRQMARKWTPAVAQLEFTQMAQYAVDCAPAPAILVEHDVTFDLYEQLLRLGDDFDLRRGLGRWRRFEAGAWSEVAKVVTMSEKDRSLVPGDKGFALANGVDLERFRPAAAEPDRGRLLFIGSFAHLPNVLALEYFLREVWPLLEDMRPKLHIIAGMRHEYFLEHHRERVSLDLTAPGIELQGFVSDVRPAYERASIVIAPLVASAGTNIKILEAMAMGKAIVSTPAGINGLDLAPDLDVLVTGSAQEMASAIRCLTNDAARRKEIERAARATVERAFDWDVIGERQSQLYASLKPAPFGHGSVRKR